jgi:tRNA(fMet)-specific endonuclease VapC
MGLVVDTNFFIDVEHNRRQFEQLNDFAEHGETFIAAVTVTELLMGVHLAGSIEQRIKRSAFVEAILANIPVLDFDAKVARTYAEVYAHFIKPLNKSGATVHDLQIAATALAHGYAVLASNTRDFDKVPGLKLA